MRLGVRNDGKGVLRTERGEKSMICPECGSQAVFVKDTKGNDSRVVQRRRFCENCKLSFWTHEEPYADLRKPKKTRT